MIEIYITEIIDSCTIEILKYNIAISDFANKSINLVESKIIQIYKNIIWSEKLEYNNNIIIR